MFLCLNCNFQFKKWAIVEFNKIKVCPVCGISKALGQYTKEVNENNHNEKIELNDVVNFDGCFYAVEKVINDETVRLSYFDGPEFYIEKEHLKLVCKSKNRIDLK